MIRTLLLPVLVTLLFIQLFIPFIFIVRYHRVHVPLNYSSTVVYLTTLMNNYEILLISIFHPFNLHKTRIDKRTCHHNQYCYAFSLMVFSESISPEVLSARLPRNNAGY